MPHDHADHAHDAHDHDHHHGHDHDHGPGGHSHAPKDFGMAFAVGATLNIGFVVAETVAGLMTHSLALLADAGHNLSDVLGLFMAWGAVILAKRAPSGRRTYGLRKGTILASLTNAVFLLVAVGAIAWEAARRFADPQAVQAGPVMIVAAIGIVVNTATALLFMSGRKGDLNIKGAFLHMAADAAVSAGVVVAGFMIVKTGLTWIDPVTSLVIVAVIAIGTWGLLRDSVNMSLQAAPPGLDPEEIGTFLRGREGVQEIHDLHVWPMSTTETALTVHLLVPGGYPGDAYTAGVAAALKEKFGIDHATIQIETDPGTPCALESDKTV